MDRAMRIVRCALFALFIICNAIICSTAVWNLSLLQPLGWDVQVNVYLIVVAALAILFSFFIMFMELIHPSGFMTLVWVECSWVGLFFVLELAGASAFLAIVPSIACDPLGVQSRLFTRVRVQVPGSCASTRLVLAFSWICALTLLIYVCFLLISAIIQAREDTKVWQSSVQHLRWSETRSQLSSAPPSPTRPRFINKQPSIVAPRPRRVVPTHLYAYRSGLSDDYQIEHYQPPEAGPAAPPAAPEPALTRNPSQRATPHNAYAATSFYPQYMQASVPQSVQQVSVPAQQATASSPPPLGEWPRRDILSQPSKSRRRPPPPLDSEIAAVASPTSPSTMHTQRPNGPRTRSSMSGTTRPPPLDLAQISTHRP
ncbi:hypothetical protein ONZ45_g18472 [Pleurotus djamor]|nr:hypothetical protein ONZ45_g18472 [Pleurotus djamor]